VIAVWFGWFKPPTPKPQIKSQWRFRIFSKLSGFGSK